MDFHQSRNKPASEMDLECGPISLTAPGGRQLLRDIRIHLRPPQLCVVTGPSGSGKTSLLRAIAGLNKAKVSLRRLGHRVYSQGELPEWRSAVTLLLQDAPCIEGSIKTNLTFPFEFKYGHGHNFNWDRAKALLKEVGLDHLEMEQDVSTLSGGERHRLALVRGLIWAPPVLMADEPLTGLEPELGLRCFLLLKRYAQQKPAIVICVVHQEDLAKQADSWWRLSDGTLYRVNPL